MERILINYNELEHRRFCGKVRDAADLTAEYVLKFANVLPFTFNDETLKDVLHSYEAQETINEIVKANNTHLYRTGIRSKSIIENAINDDVRAFKDVFSEFKNKRGYVTEYAKYLELKDETVQVIDDLESKTKDLFCQYLDTEKEKDLYDAHRKAFEGLQDFYKLLPRNFKFSFSQFFPFNVETATYSFPQTNYKMLANENANGK